MNLFPRALSLRLAVMFALVSALLLGAIGFYLYQSLEREIAWRDDQALLGRLERMQALINDSDSVEQLRSRPKLYENMLGNRDNLLWILDESGQVLIEINPAQMNLPRLPATPQALVADADASEPVRLAWKDVTQGDRRLTLIAGKLLGEREQMLAAYRFKLWLAMSVGALLAFVLGWWVSQRGLRPVRLLARRAAGIDVQHLHLRLDEFSELSELQALSHALNQMLARLEDGFAQLSRFSEDLAHEMRTPLSNLMGHTQQTLRHSRSIEDYQNLLVSNQEEYERLARMIDSMLFLARTEQSDAAVKAVQIDLHELIEQLCDYFEGVAQEREVGLINQAHDQLLADPGLVRRALANLLANALRYATPGTAVTISSTLLQDRLEITVHNQGAPIAAEHLPRLFERFYRCDPSRNQPDDSGGLGLAIVRSIMHLHDGWVSVDSDETGTRFRLGFPLAET
ncbi:MULTISPECIES: heavy metal sensor histidine kinase [unclassified Pseudomonas]|uniref:heavy metal sensor histidine kinase n=1 Tax=unclassified Pseudomonas TaxID=196821 RepID=UPI0005D31F16|nr:MULTISPECIES: heavy metal sensor histidine kinase [unclassified Pseudomonas]KJH77362.1 histidine kinase [Pseudomonas sp. ES3-33]MCA4960809.1 heavy metal sensor histidine kinase [Pseudomonas sp. Y24-6]